MELLDIRIRASNATTDYCRFNGPQLTNFVSSTIVPTFAIEPTNTASLDVTGSFTAVDAPGVTCSFPTNYIYYPYVTRIGGTESFSCSYLNQASTYTGITCASLTWDSLPTGTYALSFNQGAYITDLVANTFIITTPTTVTETAFATVTTSYTLPPEASETVTATSTSSVETVSSIPAAIPSSTVFATVYSTTVTSVTTSTPAPLSTDTATDYTSTEISTLSLLADPASTITVSVASCPSGSSTASSETLSTTSSGTSTAAACAHETECATPNGAIYRLLCSTSLIGNEISTSFQKDYQSCAAACESHGECISFSWTANKKCSGGRCSLLSSVLTLVPGGARDVSGSRTDAILLPKRKSSVFHGAPRDFEKEPVFLPQAKRSVVAHCTTCHPDHTYPPLPTSTTTVSIVAFSATVTPSPSGVETDLVYVDVTTTVVEDTPTSGVTTQTVTTDTTTTSTTTLAATVTTVIVSLVKTIYTSISPSSSSASTVTVTYCTI